MRVAEYSGVVATVKATFWLASLRIFCQTFGTKVALSHRRGSLGAPCTFDRGTISEFLAPPIAENQQLSHSGTRISFRDEVPCHCHFADLISNTADNTQPVFLK
jgi:hypothetical protein